MHSDTDCNSSYENIAINQNIHDDKNKIKFTWVEGQDENINPSSAKDNSNIKRKVNRNLDLNVHKITLSDSTKNKFHSNAFKELFKNT